jgi:predicted phage terminase large subunit-like protein
MAPKIGSLERAIVTSERSELVEMYDKHKSYSREWIRRQILEFNRIDILAIEVLGYDVQNFHLAMMRHQFAHPDSMVLVFRGAGKSTVCTITKAIHLLIKNPNLRILIASKVVTQAETFLKEIKNHFESNDKIEYYFGKYYDAKSDKKWDAREIEVLPRTSLQKEGSITCIGVGGMVVGRHYDVILSDDLVDDVNTATPHQREKVKTWYYQVLDPTLEPPSPDVPHRGEHHRMGTRYHHADLYGHLLKNELKDSTLTIRALDEEGRSPWPKKYPAKWFRDKKRKSGTIIFNAQYQCDTEAMMGEIFQYDHCKRIPRSEYPALDTLKVYMGVDLAISEDEKADKFAIVVIGIDNEKNVYVLEYFEDQLRFNAQTEKILELYAKWDPIKCAIETNAYQLAQYQHLKHQDKEIRLKPVVTIRDKIARAWKLSPRFEDGKVFFALDEHDHLIEHFVLFPNHRYKDLFDAFDLAINASKRRKRDENKRPEPGLI